MREFATMTNLAVWYSRQEVGEVVDTLRSQVDPKRLKLLEKNLAKTRTRDSMHAFSKLTEVVDGEPRIISDPPLIQPARDILHGAPGEAVMEQLRVIVRNYRESLQSDRRVLLEQFRFVDIAFKVVGVGSVGTRAWIVLLMGKDGADPLFLQFKEAQASVLEEFLQPSEYSTHSERVVAGQHLMQTSSDIFLGWLHAKSNLDGQHRDFYGRQLKDWKGSIEVDSLTAEGMTIYGELCGWTLARAHARSGDRIAIASYLGGGEVFDQAIAEFSTGLRGSEPARLRGTAGSREKRSDHRPHRAVTSWPGSRSWRSPRIISTTRHSCWLSATAATGWPSRSCPRGTRALTAARGQIEAVLGGENASGVAAYRGGSMAGFMIGRSRGEALWGRNAWIDAAGHAAADPEVVRDLYAAAAVRWWELGLTRQYALVPAFDPHVLDAWWRLGFGQQQAMAIREVQSHSWPEHVRQATTNDLDALVALEPLVDQAHRESPVFSEVYRDDDPETLRGEYIDDLADDAVATLVYEREGRIPGALAVVPIEHSPMHAGLVRPDGQCLLSFAATLPSDRGSGVGLALTEGALAWAGESGTRQWPPTGASPTCCPRDSGRAAVSGRHSCGCTGRCPR